MNVRIFWVRAMKCMCAQTRPRFILSSEGVFGGMEFEPMWTPREKSPLPENVPRGRSNPRHRGQRAQALPTELFRPRSSSELQSVCGGIPPGYVLRSSCGCIVCVLGQAKLSFGISVIRVCILLFLLILLSSSLSSLLSVLVLHLLLLPPPSFFFSLWWKWWW